jgi:hypothetical protein
MELDFRATAKGPPGFEAAPGEHLIIQPNALVFYIDDTGDERMNNRDHPIFAFGGVATVGQFHLPIARTWQAMKARTFPQVTGPLHAKKHLRDRLSRPKRQAVLKAVAHEELGRFGSVMTSSTVVPLDKVIQVACGSLAVRLAHVAEGFVSLGLWSAPGRVVAVFEQSTRLTRHLEQQFPDQIRVGTHAIPVEGCFMPKSVANPFLEMADFIANTIGKNVHHQLEHGRESCTKDFQALFRDVGPPLANYMEMTEAIF